jgi:hypothetical protein
MKLDSFNRKGQLLESREPSLLVQKKRGAVLSVHGIRTIGEWQDNLADWVQDAGFHYARTTYGNILWTSPLPPALTYAMGQLQHRYDELLKRQLPISAIAHSFGTLALGHLLWRRPSTQFHRVILYGSVLSPKYPWLDCATRHQVNDVLHEIAGQDIWPWLAPLAFVLHRKSGWSGVRGFRRPPANVVQTYSAGSGHSDLQTPAHFRRIWIPFIAEGPSALRGRASAWTPKSGRTN